MGKFRTEKLTFPLQTSDPFLFLVYHKDKYPPGNARMEAPKRGNGADFDPDAEYRMYHGDRIPGFPQHPHRGFETLTATITGIIDHTDSLGCGGRYGMGDLQWMTAGRGVVHGENFPLIKTDGPNVNRFFQIWLNLPGAKKMVEPTQVMHWAEEIPIVSLQEGKVKVTVWAGTFNGTKALPPPPNSWGADPANDVTVLLFTLKPGGSVTVPPAKAGSMRNLYFVEGSALLADEQKISTHSRIVVEQPTAELVLKSPADAKDDVEVLLLQGQPIKERVVQHGPFVMNTSDQIRQAFYDYQQTRFGGWPWKEDAVIFPRDQGRFVEIGGKKQFPPATRDKRDL